MAHQTVDHKARRQAAPDSDRRRPLDGVAGVAGLAVVVALEAADVVLVRDDPADVAKVWK